MQNRLTIFFLLLAAVSHPTAGASDSLTINQCVAIAKANNLNLSIAGDTRRAAASGKTAAGKALLPRFSFSGGAGYAPWSLSFGYDPAVSTGGELGARIIGKQTVYDGGIRSLDMREAGLSVDFQDVAYRQTERDVVFAVRQAFIDLLRAQQEQSSRDESASRLSEYVDLAERLNAAGTAGYTDLLSARIGLTNARAEAMRAARQAETARYRLVLAMGTPDDTTFAVTGSLDNLLVVTEDITEPLSPIDVSGSLDMRAAQVDYSLSRISVSRIKAERLPQIVLTGDAGVLTSRQNLQMPAPERYNSFGYSVGVGIDMPLWDWGARKALVEQSVFESRAAFARIKVIEQSIQAEYRTLRAQMENAAQLLQEIRTTL
jgi:outer membrane protein TolC